MEAHLYNLTSPLAGRLASDLPGYNCYAGAGRYRRRLEWATSQLWLYLVAPLICAAAAGLLWLGAEDSVADRVEADRLAALEPGEPLAPGTAREPR